MACSGSGATGGQAARHAARQAARQAAWAPGAGLDEQVMAPVPGKAHSITARRHDMASCLRADKDRVKDTSRAGQVAKVQIH